MGLDIIPSKLIQLLYQLSLHDGVALLKLPCDLHLSKRAYKPSRPTAIPLASGTASGCRSPPKHYCEQRERAFDLIDHAGSLLSTIYRCKASYSESGIHDVRVCHVSQVSKARSLRYGSGGTWEFPRLYSVKEPEMFWPAACLCNGNFFYRTRDSQICFDYNVASRIRIHAGQKNRKKLHRVE